jgi:DNA-binding response OmpR family regulator
VSGRNDNNAANTGPVSDDPSLLHGKEAHTPTTTASSRQRQTAQQQTARRILVVDDDLSLAALEAEVLTAHGYIVFTVPSGDVALCSLQQSLPDLVVLDLELTGNLNGWEVFQALRTFSDVPVLITTSSITAVRPHLRSSGETRLTLDHLPKPYPLQMLLKRIKRMLPTVP